MLMITPALASTTTLISSTYPGLLAPLGDRLYKTVDDDGKVTYQLVKNDLFPGQITFVSPPSTISEGSTYTLNFAVWGTKVDGTNLHRHEVRLYEGTNPNAIASESVVIDGTSNYLSKFVLHPSVGRHDYLITESVYIQDCYSLGVLGGTHCYETWSSSDTKKTWVTVTASSGSTPTPTTTSTVQPTYTAPPPSQTFTVTTIVSANPPSGGTIEVYKNGAFLKKVTTSDTFSFLSTDKVSLFPYANTGYMYQNLCDYTGCITGNRYEGYVKPISIWQVSANFNKISGGTTPTTQPTYTQPTPQPTITYIHQTLTPTAAPTYIQPPIPSGTGELVISSSPNGGSIYVDGELKGTTPTSLILSLGQHTVKITLVGYKDYEVTGLVKTTRSDLNAVMEAIPIIVPTPPGSGTPNPFGTPVPPPLTTTPKPIPTPNIDNLCPFGFTQVGVKCVPDEITTETDYTVYIGWGIIIALIGIFGYYIMKNK